MKCSLGGAQPLVYRHIPLARGYFFGVYPDGMGSFILLLPKEPLNLFGAKELRGCHNHRVA